MSNSVLPQLKPFKLIQYKNRKHAYSMTDISLTIYVKKNDSNGDHFKLYDELRKKHRHCRFYIIHWEDVKSQLNYIDEENLYEVNIYKRTENILCQNNLNISYVDVTLSYLKEYLENLKSERLEAELKFKSMKQTGQLQSLWNILSIQSPSQAAGLLSRSSKSTTKSASVNPHKTTESGRLIISPSIIPKAYYALQTPPPSQIHRPRNEDNQSRTSTQVARPRITPTTTVTTHPENIQPLNVIRGPFTPIFQRRARHNRFSRSHIFNEVRSQGHSSRILPYSRPLTAHTVTGMTTNIAPSTTRLTPPDSPTRPTQRVSISYAPRIHKPSPQ